MRKLLVLLSLVATQAFAEASFEQIEGLIQQKNYAAAEAGLEVIVKNHPQSAKAFYAMAQAQAGLGNLEKAQKALNIATGLNPTLDFAPEGSVRKLKEAITPQTAKIEQIEESHFWRDFWVGFIMFAGVGIIITLILQKKRKEEEAELSEKLAAQAERERERAELAEQIKQSSKAAKSKKSTFTPVTSSALAKDKPATASIATSGPAVQQPLYTPQPTHTTVVNNSNDGLLTGILIGDMLNHHHDTPRVVEREVIREVPTPSRSSSRDSSWDDTPSTSSSRSSSWDSSSSSSSSSSWDSSSSSSSSSSWDSGSSSSDSSSSSSWD